jgi:hypothetical protein
MDAADAIPPDANQQTANPQSLNYGVCPLSTIEKFRTSVEMGYDKLVANFLSKMVRV